MPLEGHIIRCILNHSIDFTSRLFVSYTSLPCTGPSRSYAWLHNRPIWYKVLFEQISPWKWKINTWRPWEENAKHLPKKMYVFTQPVQFLLCSFILYLLISIPLPSCRRAAIQHTGNGDWQGGDRWSSCFPSESIRKTTRNLGEKQSVSSSSGDSFSWKEISSSQ